LTLRITSVDSVMRARSSSFHCGVMAMGDY